MNPSHSEQEFEIRFPEADDSDANIFAHDLAYFLNTQIVAEETPTVIPKRSNSQAQDFGTTLVLILGTASITAIAKGLQAWLKGHTGASMEIVTKQGRVVLRNIESKSAAEIAKAFSEVKK